MEQRLKLKTRHRIRFSRWLIALVIIVSFGIISATLFKKTDAAAGNITWTPHSAAEANNWTSMAWSPELNLFAAVSNIGSLNRVMTSPDGTTWTSRSALGVNDHWRSITWSSQRNLFVAVGSAGGVNKVMTSPDGVTWTARTPSENGDWVAVTWSPEQNLFVAVGNGGSRVMTSSDGITWTSRTAAQGNAWFSVTWSPQRNLFVAVSTNGTNRVMTSPDGITWTVRSAAEANEWRSVTWSPELGLFVAVATTGTNRVMTSPDGVTWTARLTPEANPLSSVTWSPQRGVFVAVASSGANQIITSNDGINWTGQAAPEVNGWTTAVWASGLNKFVAVASSGTNRVMVGSPVGAVGPGGVVNGLIAWQRADDGTANGATWQDSSGMGNTATQATAANQPMFVGNGVNFNPAMQLDGTNDFMAIPTMNHSAARAGEEMFAAVLPSASVGNGNILGWGDVTNTTTATELRYINNSLQYGAGQGWSAITSNAASAGHAQIADAHRFKDDSIPAKLLIDGSEVASGTMSARPTMTQMDIGARRIQATDDQVFTGLIAETIFFNRELTVVEREKVASYLAIKYGITLGHNYVDSAGTTIWNKTTNAIYSNAIAGIGRDDSGGLNQKQSKSIATDSLVTVGHGDIAATNQANTNDFSADKSFMVWGNDAANTDQTVNVTGTSYARMSRIWQTEVAGAVGPVKVQIPTSAITRNQAVLLVSDSPTFDNTSQVVTMAVNGANYEVTTTMAAGTHYFTFASEAGADIEMVSKTATDTSNTAIANYTPGQPLEYHLTVRNNGPDDAGLITVSDTLPGGIVPTVNGASGDGWSCSVSVPTVTCTRPSLATGTTAPEIIIEATIASSVAGQKVNTATATEATDPDTSNNSKSVMLDAAPIADLSIAKEDTTPGSPTAGTEYDYKFTVRNDGPSDVASYTIADSLPVGLTYVDSSPTTACPGSSGQNVTCTGGAIPAGQTSVIAIKVHVDTGGNYTNTATVAVPAGTTDPNPGNNSSTNVTNVNVETDMTVSKTHTGNFIAGDNNTFTINATNNGPSEAPTGSVTVTDTLDEDFTYVSAVGTNWSCNTPPNTTVTCTYNAALASGATTPNITLTVLVDSIAKGTTSNTTTISSTTPDPDQTNNSSVDNVTIVADADLAIAKGHVGTAFTPGQQAQYTFSVTNNGPSADTPTYTITDALPTGLTFVSTAAGSDATCTSGDGTNVTCTGGGIGAGDPAQVTTINVTVDSGASGTFSNTATVAPDASVTDTNSGNNTSNDVVNIEPNADLSIVKAHSGNLTAGDNEDYTVTVTNSGPSDVSSFTITDTFDPNLTYQSSSPNVSCVGTTTVTCTGGTVTSGGSEIVTLTVAVKSNAVQGFNISNTATVAPPADINDPDLSNNSSTISNTVEGSADLAVTKTHTGNFKPASNGSFDITVTNNGPSDSDSFTVTDTLPAGLTYVSAMGDANCTNTSQTVTCAGPMLDPTDSATITLTVAVDPGVTSSSIDNTASVTSATPDPTPANNSDTDTVTIDTATADLVATKNAQGALTAGSPVTYRFEVTNATGPDNAGNVTISDTLPSYLSYQSFASVSGTWNCSASGQDVTCVVPAVNVGDTAIVDVTVGVAQDAPSPAENNAAVAFNGTDPSPNNPSASDPVSYAADLEVHLTHNSETYHSGDTVTYTYTVINHGPSAASDVVLTDTLPEGLNFENIVATNTKTGESSVVARIIDTVLGTTVVSAAPNTPFDCSVSGQNITCSANTVMVGTYVITMTARIADNFTGNLTSMLQITSSTFDPNMANNISTDTITDVTLASGLAGTGQNLWVWLIAAVGVIAISVTGIVLVRRRARL